MKTELEKMRSGELYSFADAEVTASIVHAQKLCARLQVMSIHDEDYRKVMEELIPFILIPQALPITCANFTGSPLV